MGLAVRVADPIIVAKMVAKRRRRLRLIGGLS
jgi:hypothetical protein